LAGPDFELERKALASGLDPVCGIDEVGWGPWAGPVVTAAVILDPRNIPNGINDSKLLTALQRDRLHDEIMASSLAVAFAAADVERIDRDNVLAATLWAMAEAVKALSIVPCYALVDGNRAPRLSCPVETIVGGDGLSLSIAAASIIAKVTRDRLMTALDTHFPQYGFARHKGYGTPEHLEALRRHGPCPHHRSSFAPVRECQVR
jgi:ribonuclease HII